MDRKALEAGQERTRTFLRTAARLELAQPRGDTVRARITNLTGHKLPTGYIEGRRMWLRVRFLDGGGKVLAEAGKYGDKADTLAGKAVTSPTILDPDATRVYECIMGLGEEQARKHGKTPGKSFHFVLGDVVLKDNRIPPRGFRNAAFAAHLCQPVGASYADGQDWDEVDFRMPTGTARVEAELLLQSVSWEYLKFLVEENRTDDWGKRLYQVWTETGRCPPDVMASATVDVKS